MRIVDLNTAPREEWLEKYELLDADGEPLDLVMLPSRRAYSGEEGSSIILRRDRESGEVLHHTAEPLTEHKRDPKGPTG